ncbi:MAG: hypothetical protein J6Y94_05450, partial [Bacteriovoracaceae bacterium]|nr:hypothetical protein [Bacteriovoracaceae bacterium]
MKTSRCFSRWFSVLVFSAIVGALLLGLGAGAQAKVSLPPKRGVSPAQGLDPGQDQALQYEVGHYWAGQDLLSYAHRDNALRFYYQNPHTKRIEQEVTEDVQTFLAYAAEKRQIAFNRDGNDEEFLRDAEEALIDADISDEQGGMRYGKAEITIVDKKYVVRYVHQESGLAFIILRPSQNPQPGKTPLWPQGNTVEELARSHSSASLNANWLADGAILGPEQAVDLKSRHLRQVLANQVMESDRAKGRHAILVLLSAQGEDLPLFMPGQVLPQYMPPRLFSKAYWKCYRYATLFAPDAGYWPFALFLA